MLYYDSEIVPVSIRTDAQTIIQALQVNTYLMPRRFRYMVSYPLG